MKGIIYSLKRRSSIGCQAILAACTALIVGAVPAEATLMAPIADVHFLGYGRAPGFEPWGPLFEPISFDLILDDTVLSEFTVGSGSSATAGPSTYSVVFAHAEPDRGAAIARASFTSTRVWGNFSTPTRVGTSLNIFFEGAGAQTFGDRQFASVDAGVSFVADVFSNGAWTTVDEHFQAFNYKCQGIDCNDVEGGDGNTGINYTIQPGELFRFSQHVWANVFAVNPVPEPPTIILVLFGVMLVLMTARFRTRHT
jgi:hypothetical protein